jgi:hypothetical protein
MTGSNSLRFPLPFVEDAYERMGAGRAIRAAVKHGRVRRDGPESIMDMATTRKVKYKSGKVKSRQMILPSRSAAS